MLSTSKVDIILHDQTKFDENPELNKFEPVEGVLPGMDCNKFVLVRNRGANAWVRVKMTATYTLEDDTVEEIPIDQYVQEIIYDDQHREKETQWHYNDGYFTLRGTNPDDWVYRDGWFYYVNKGTGYMPLGSGTRTVTLLTGVKFHEDMPNKYKNSTFTLDVYAQAVQSRHNAEETYNIFNATGWPEEESAS